MAEPEQTQRNAEIHRLHEAGMTFREIGALHGVTGTRARQIWIKERRKLQSVDS